MIDAIPSGYLLFLGRETAAIDVKTARGILHWRPELCVGQYRLDPGAFDLGLPDFAPGDAFAAGARTLVIGCAPFGGAFAADWIAPMVDALNAGLDIASGMHSRLTDVPELVAAAERNGRRLHDVRHPRGPRRVATGRRRSGKRLLTVGTDCAIGKKYTALALDQGLRERGVPATFRATGQTGILIAGGGVAIDATVSDFAAGAAEDLSPDNDPGHWDVIEGQGSLFHPAYAGVSLALLHGSQPDAIVVCHDTRRRTIDGYPDFSVPAVGRCIDANLAAARLVNPDVRCVGVSLDTSGMSDSERIDAIASLEAETGLPVVDPVATGVGRVIERLLAVERAEAAA